MYEKIGTVRFPKPTGINVNMMPFVMGNVDSISDELRPYWDMVEACGVEPDEIGKVGYLTVMESEVTPGLSQRRGGAHVERHPNNGWGGGGWGYGGRSGEGRVQGLYIASNMQETTGVWDAFVDIEDIGEGGNCEHLNFGEQMTLAANELIWLTDRTPHESLPLKEKGMRQFFRLVTSPIDVWFTQHSTPNPLVPLPERVMPIMEDKFV